MFKYRTNTFRCKVEKKKWDKIRIPVKKKILIRWIKFLKIVKNYLFSLDGFWRDFWAEILTTSPKSVSLTSSVPIAYKLNEFDPSFYVLDLKYLLVRFDVEIVRSQEQFVIPTRNDIRNALCQHEENLFANFDCELVATVQWTINSFRIFQRYFDETWNEDTQKKKISLNNRYTMFEDHSLFALFLQMNVYLN